MTYDASGLDEFHPDTSHNASPKIAPILWLDVVETKPLTQDDWYEYVGGVTSDGDFFEDDAAVDAAYRHYVDRHQPFRLVLKSGGNNEILMQGESYFHKDDALHTARLIGSAGTTVFLRQPKHGNETLRIGVVDNGGTESDTSE